jgi:hypothetical protein
VYVWKLLRSYSLHSWLITQLLPHRFTFLLHFLLQVITPGRLEALGLSHLGEKLRSKWPEEDEVLFGMGMLERFKNFKHMKRR